MNKYQKTLITIASIASLALAFPALADSQGPNQNGQQGGGLGGFFSSMFHMGGGNKPPAPNGGSNQGYQAGMLGRPMMGNRVGQMAVVGNVTAINGTTLSVKSRRPGTASTSTISVDASNATIFKVDATSSISSIAIGDNVIVQGTIVGNNVTATIVRDIQSMGGNKGTQASRQKEMPQAPTGNGQPVVIGNITSISGNSIVISNKSNVNYTVDVSSAHILKQGVNGTSTVSNLAVGDGVIVQGTVNGSAITASTVIDRGVAPSNPENSNASSSEQNKPKFVGGVFGSIGSFFTHLFGF